MRHRLFHVVVCLSLALVPEGAVLAAGARKAPPKDAELDKKEATKVPERDLAGDITRHKKAKDKERPALEYDQYKLGVELQVASKRREQMETLQKIIQLGPSPGEAPDLYFRLAELYWEESKFFSFEANRKDDEIFAAKAANDEAKVALAEAEKKDALKKFESYQTMAVDQYRTVVKKYPKYPRMDEVLYFLGQNMWEGDKKKEAATVYQKLIKDHPKSKYLPDAYLAIGQYYFEGSKGQKEPLLDSLENFKKAATYTESKVYGFALYMQGWAYFNLGDFKSAMDMYRSVIYFGELQGKGDKRTTALSREARKDYVVAYSRFGDVMAAKEDFKKVGGQDNWWMMLKGLANLYFEDGKDREASVLYKLMITERPLSPESPFFQGRIVDCVIRVGQKSIIVNQVRELVRIIKEVEKAGVAKEEDKKSFQEARELAERIMSNLAVNWHNEAKKTRDDKVFFLAGEIYQDYLEVFSDNPKAYDLRFFYAELLNDNLNKYDRAADEYSKVVLWDIARMEPPAAKDGSKPAPEKPGRWLVNAAYNAILAYDEVAKKSEKDEQLPKDNDPKKKLPIPPAKKNLLLACERYIKYVPQGEKFVQVLYKAGYIFYRYNYFEQSTPLLSKICMEHTDAPDDLGITSCNLVLDSYNLLGDWTKVNEWARKFYQNPKMAKGKFKDDLAKVLEQSSFKLVNLAEERQDYTAAAEAYLAFVGEFPQSDLADLALFNASVDYFKGKQVDRSIEVRKQIVEKYPNSRYLPQCVYANGESFETVADFEQAAESYEQYALKWAALNKAKKGGKTPGKKGAPAEARSEAASGFEEGKAQVALFNAGVFREGLGQFKEAIADRLKYIELWPDAKDSEAIFMSVAELFQKAGVPAKALHQLEEYQKKYGRDADKTLSSELKIAKVYEKMGKAKDAQRIYGRALDYYEKKMTKAMQKGLGPASVEAVAKAAYLAIEPDFAAYQRLGFPKDDKKLKAALEAKQKALVEVQKKYAEVVALKAAEPAICSLYKIGLLYKNFADSLISAPVPEMPFPKEQLKKAGAGPLLPYWNTPWARWPKELREAVPEETFHGIKAQLVDAAQQFEQAYRDQLIQWAAPVEEKAADAFALTVEKSRELAIYNDCSDKALDLLSEKYKPQQYPKMTETPLPMKTGPEMRAGSPILATVQPIPPPPKEKPKAIEEPSPDTSRIGAPQEEPSRPSPKAQVVDSPPAEDKPTQPADRQPPAKNERPRTEPDDPDLLN
ncbi:MAG: tetratricopeptide repeat protein [Deltaproteobacteria bacterium]|nr:tetratricopeptide repeat protein [Deltaproteobacteria bacterium]